jgi:hypothetical protein
MQRCRHNDFFRFNAALQYDEKRTSQRHFKNSDLGQREAISGVTKRLCCSAFAIRHANVYIPPRRNFAKFLHAMRGQGAEIAWP